MAKTVLVMGDLLYDFNLVRLPSPHLAYSELLPSAVLSKHRGNAWYQADLVRIACSDIAIDIAGPVYGDEATSSDGSEIAQAYSLWSPFERETGSKEKVWRIERFLGCQAPIEIRKPGELPANLEPDLMLFDDENMGFRNNQELWKGPLKVASSAQIVLKATVPLGKGALWRTLFDNHADNLTVLLTARQLRTQNAAISEALSWDLAREELDREFKKGRLASDLGSAEQVIVYFSGAGTASYRRGRLERFIFHPEELEGLWFARHPGKTFGGLSIISAAVVRHKLEPQTFSAMPVFLAKAGFKMVHIEQ